VAAGRRADVPVVGAVRVEALEPGGDGRPALRLRVAALQEVVHAPRLVAAALALRLLLAVEDLVEPPAQLVGGLVQAELLLERALLAAQLLHQLLEAHHAQVGTGELEACALHPLEGLGEREALHHPFGERVEGGLRLQREGRLRAVPAAVAPDPHRPARDA
jgi:hypothetical protein